MAAFAASGTDWTDVASNVDDLPIADIEPGPDTVRVAFSDAAPLDPAATFAATPVPQVVANAAADYTDSHPHAHHNKPIADIEPGLAKPLYVALPEPDDDTTVVLVPDSDTPQLGEWDDNTDTLSWGAAAAAGAKTPSWDDTQPIPTEAYVPPTVPVTTAEDQQGQAPLGDLGGLAATGAAAEPPTWPVEPPPPAWPTEPSQAAEPTAPAVPVAAEPEATPAPAPQRMKRVRVVRRLVVDGEVVQEQVVEEIVPADADTATTAEQLRESLGHATPEQIAQMAHLDPNTPLELRQKTELPGADGTQQ